MIIKLKKEIDDKFMNKMLFRGKQVHLYYLKDDCSINFESFCNYSVDIIELFNINVARKNPEYCIKDIESILRTFNSDNRTIYHKKLLDIIQKEFYFNYYSLEKKIIVKVEKMVYLAIF